MGCIVSKVFLDFYIFFIFTRPLRPCRATFFSQINSRACTAIRHYIVGDSPTGRRWE